MWRVVNVLDDAAFDNEKSTSWVNFMNVLRAPFVHADPESVKKTDNFTDFFPFRDLLD
jgi:hypothetical protein